MFEKLSVFAEERVRRFSFDEYHLARAIFGTLPRLSASGRSLRYCGHRLGRFIVSPLALEHRVWVFWAVHYACVCERTFFSKRHIARFVGRKTLKNLDVK